MKPKGWTAAVVFTLTLGLALASAAGDNDHRDNHRKKRQTVTVFVPATASGGFGNSGNVGEVSPIFPMVEALTVTRRGKITITYVSGVIIGRGDIGEVGPEGIDTASCSSCNGQFPLQEAVGISGVPYANILAVIGAFVPSQTPPTHPLPLCDVKPTVWRVEPGYAVCTSSKSHSCCAGKDGRAARRSAWGRYTTNDSCGFKGMRVPWGEAKRVG
jgi:hypothetical protein